MRNWIDLFEADDFAAQVKALAPHDSVAEPGYGYTIDGTPFEMTDQHIFDMRQRIEQVLARNPTVYRYVLLRPADLAKYLAGTLGVFWCHDHDINVDALTGWDSAPDDAELYRLTATIHPANVDMVRTVVQNLSVPWENEITMKPGSPIMLRSVDLLPDSDQYARPVKQSFVARSYTA